MYRLILFTVDIDIFIKQNAKEPVKELKKVNK